jgi:hypothetical protein
MARGMLSSFNISLLFSGHHLETFPCFSTNQSMSLRAMLILPGIGGK